MLPVPMVAQRGPSAADDIKDASGLLHALGEGERAVWPVDQRDDTRAA